MVNVLDVATQGAIRDRSRVVPRNFLVVRVKALSDGSPVIFGFTDFGQDIAANVLDGNTLQLVSHTFYGDGAPIQKLDQIPRKIGLDIDTIGVVLNAAQPVVANMAKAHDCRNAKVELYRGYLDPWSGLLVAAPRCRKLGQINGMPTVKGALGQAGTVTIKFVGSTRLLTRTSGAMRSDETQKLRGGDRARRYGGAAHKWPIHWGEAKA